MKSRTLLSTLVLVLAVLIISSCATGKKASVSKEEELYGTWINTDYDKTVKYAKIIIKPDGIWEEYKSSYRDIPGFKGEYTITDKWTDSEGNLFYKIIVTPPDMPYYILSKIDKTGDVYEDLWSTRTMPTEIDPDNIQYRIYYRQ